MRKKRVLGVYNAQEYEEHREKKKKGGEEGGLGGGKESRSE